MYPLTVLEEAVSKIAMRVGFTSLQALVDAYPAVKAYRPALENMLHDIGKEILTFPIIRNKDSNFALARYGIPFVPTSQSSTTSTAPTIVQVPKPQPPATSAAPPTSTPTSTSPPPTQKSTAVAIDDERSVLRKLRSFAPRGQHREKVEL